MSSAPHLRSSTACLVCAALVCMALVACGLIPESLRAQSIRGTLLQRGTDTPIALGFVALLSESGDSIASVITNSVGEFFLTSPDPGDFLLLAAALGHRETTVGVFELGVGGELTVEFRIAVAPLTVEGLIVQADRISQQPALVRNGFSRRMQQGFGRFITPGEIESSTVSRTLDLFVGMEGVRIVGDALLLRDCVPQLYVDGIPMSRAADLPVSLIVPFEALAAAEVYLGAAEVPLQYGGTVAPCGVILFWTKEGN